MSRNRRSRRSFNRNRRGPRPQNGQTRNDHSERIVRTIKPPRVLDFSTSKFILLDRDDFYFTTLDLVLFNFTQESPLLVNNEAEYIQFKAALEKGDLKNRVYVIDEYFIEDTEQMHAMIELIKQQDPEAKLISYSVSEADEVVDKDLYDYFVQKSGMANDKSLIHTLSEILGINFVANNSDPEYDLVN